MGIDLNREKIQAARNYYPEITFRKSDIRDLGADDEAFDTVVIAEVLEHVEEESGAAMLATAWRLLKPGGRLVVSVPNENYVPHANHVREFTRSSLRDLLKHLGKPRTITTQHLKWLMMVVEK